MPPQEPQGQPLSYEAAAREIAQRAGVNPALALAVMTQESGGDPEAVGDGGQALGLFQLHEAAATDVGLDATQRENPLLNISGGVQYLKQLQDRYDGDLQKTLQAYNGGMGNVDAGSVSPEAAAYATTVLSRMLRGAASGAPAAPVQVPGAPAQVGAAAQPGVAPAAAQAPTTGGAPSPPVAPPPGAAPGAAPSDDPSDDPSLIWRLGSSIVSSFDPRTFAGRVNLAATAGAVLTGGGSLAVVGVGTAVKAGVLPWIARMLAAPVGAALAGGGEAAIETAIGTAPEGTNPITEGALQGAYEIGGRTLLWPFRAVAGIVKGFPVARRAREVLEAGVTQAKATGRSALASVQEAVASVADTLRMLRQASSTARGEAAEGVTAAVGRATGAGARGTAEVAERLAQQELAVAGDLVTLTKQYDNLMARPPSTIAAGDTATSVMRGPAQRALDIAGERVSMAAEQGPPVDFAPVKEALEAMAEQARPAALFGEQAEAGVRGMGFLDNVRAVGAAGREVAEVGNFDPTALNRAIAEQLGVDPTQMSPKLPGLLGQVLRAPDEVSFADAHQVKMLLDEAVSWDRVAKKHLERLTKGVRQVLRGQLSGFAPYDEATAVYHAMVPLYRRGIGQQILRLARDPDGAARIAASLGSRDPAQALTLRTLLLDQAAAGGNPKLGQQAWDGIREVFTHEQIIRGGIEGLSDRVQTLLTEAPEFARALYHDLPSQKVLSNLDRIGAAFTTAVDQGATARLAGRGAQAAAKRADVRAVQTEGRRGVEGAEAMLTAFRKAVVGKLAPEQAIADAVRGAGLGPFQIWGALSLIRLALSTRGDDLLRWAAYSDASTQMFLRVMYGTATDRTTAGFIRAASSAAFGDSATAERELKLPPPPDETAQR